MLLGILSCQRPERKAFCLAIGSIAFITFLVDAKVLHHRLAMKWRTWSPFWHDSHIVDILPSPSGCATAYIIAAGFQDIGYSALISDGALFPKHCLIKTGHSNASYPRDLSATWSGTVFTAAEMRYDEATGLLTPTNF